METSGGLSKLKLSLEKQEHLVKLAILTIAAMLCEFLTLKNECEVMV